MRILFIILLLFTAIASQAQNRYFNTVKTQIISANGDTSNSQFNADLLVEVDINSMEISLTEGILTQTRDIIDVMLLANGETVLVLPQRTVTLNKNHITIFFIINRDSGIITVSNKYSLE